MKPELRLIRYGRCTSCGRAIFCAAVGTREGQAVSSLSGKREGETT